MHLFAYYLYNIAFIADTWYIVGIGMGKLLTILSGMLCLLLVSCGHPLESESGLYHVELRDDFKLPIDGVWSWGKGNPYADQQSGHIYIEPLDISLVEEDEPELAPLMIPQMHEHMVQYFNEILQEINQVNGKDWQLTDDPAQAQIRISMALVHFRPQKPALRFLGEIVSYLIPLPMVSRVVGRLSKGCISIEATIRDNKTGDLLMAFKDTNRKPSRLYRAHAYKRSGNADANLKTWARMLAGMCRAAAPDQLGDATLRQKFEDYSYAASLRDKLKNRL